MIIKCSLAVVKHRLVRAARWVKISFAFCVSCGHRSVGRAGECLFLHLFQRSGERCSGCKSKLLYLDIEASERKPFIITSCFVADGKMLIRISDRCIMTENYTGSSCCTRSPYGLFFLHPRERFKEVDFVAPPPFLLHPGSPPPSGSCGVRISIENEARAEGRHNKRERRDTGKRKEKG